MGQSKISTLKVAAIYIGAVIGAGFASGQEILQFIIVHGPDGFKEVCLITLLFSYLGAITLYLAVKFRTDNYLILLNFLVGKKIAKLLDIISILMLAGGLVVMLSGSGAVFSEHLNMASWLGIGIIVLLTGLVLVNGMRGVVWVNAFLAPIKIAAILAVSISLINIQNPLPSEYVQWEPHTEVHSHWFLSGLLYVSYNMILVFAVLSTIGKDIDVKRAVSGGVLGGLGLGFTAGMIYLAGLSQYPEIAVYKIPMLYMAGLISEGVKNALGLLIWMAILTTTVANAHGFAARFAKANTLGYRLIGIGLTILVVPLSRLDFDRLVGLIYPIFGYAGLLLIFILVFTPLLKLLLPVIFRGRP